MVEWYIEMGSADEDLVGFEEFVQLVAEGWAGFYVAGPLDGCYPDLFYLAAVLEVVQEGSDHPTWLAQLLADREDEGLESYWLLDFLD